MYGINLLVDEHENIYAFTEYLSRSCCTILDGAEIDIQEFRACIDFARNYADKHHHGKEEQIVFRLMLDTEDGAARQLIRGGMLVEHDFGRYHIGELEKALAQYEKKPTTEGKLAVITHAAGYVDLLQRHIEKENAVCFPYALRLLSKERQMQMNELTRIFEEKAQQRHIQEKYTAWIKNRKRI